MQEKTSEKSKISGLGITLLVLGLILFVMPPITGNEFDKAINYFLGWIAILIGVMLGWKKWKKNYN